jgi:hypothetical protein
MLLLIELLFSFKSLIDEDKKLFPLANFPSIVEDKFELRIFTSSLE